MRNKCSVGSQHVALKVILAKHMTSFDGLIYKLSLFICPIIPKRSLYLGDLLLLKLFILCSEGLSSIFTYVEEECSIISWHISKEAFVVSHLFLADDSFFFFCAAKEDCGVALTLIFIYKSNSDQVIKKEKSGVFFSNNVSQEMHMLCPQL